jgi:hypothetical protein
MIAPIIFIPWSHVPRVRALFEPVREYLPTIAPQLCPSSIFGRWWVKASLCHALSHIECLICAKTLFRTTFYLFSPWVNNSAVNTTVSIHIDASRRSLETRCTNGVWGGVAHTPPHLLGNIRVFVPLQNHFLSLSFHCRRKIWAYPPLEHCSPSHGSFCAWTCGLAWPGYSLLGPSWPSFSFIF